MNYLLIILFSILIFETAMKILGLGYMTQPLEVIGVGRINKQLQVSFTLVPPPLANVDTSMVKPPHPSLHGKLMIVKSERDRLFARWNRRVAT
ncbi:hypothetical protein B566_EDAN011168 [Ephemera danica]|nr:hypothetical protein B566_EDAN011168 [Ephemera danica]